MEGPPVLSRFEALDYKDYLLAFLSLVAADLPIIDVGSGNAAVAYYLLQHRPDAIIYCVDPMPTSYPKEKETKQVMIEPHAATVDDLLLIHPELVGNCAIMLIRPQPPKPGFVCYDVPAWKALKPKVGLVMYQADGGDGSPQLHSVLHQFGCPSYNLDREYECPDDFPTYYSWSIRFTSRSPPPIMVAVPTCSLLINADVDGLKFPADIDEGEQNPDAPNDEEIESLLFKSTMLTGLSMLMPRDGDDGADCVLQ
jgi:hypothetical protein